MHVTVLRLGHRVQRDERISTHVGLVARAFGADEIIYSGEKDENVLNSIKDVVHRWGGSFTVRYQKVGKRVIREFRGYRVLLSMYGLDLRKGIQEVREAEPNALLVVVGGAKVPGEVYGLVDMNLAVTHQPHSEVAALAVFLHEWYGGDELKQTYPNARLQIVPKRKGKKVKKRNDPNDPWEAEEDPA